MLYAYCAEHGVGHRRCGKLIVANGADETKRLAELLRRGTENGVDDLEWLDGARARQLEPALRASAAILSPSSGVVDSHALMLALRGDAEAAGAVLALMSPVTGGSVEDGGIVLDVGGAEPTRLLCAGIFNCAGLGAQRIAHGLAGLERRDRSRALHGQGQLFHPERKITLPEADLSHADDRRPGRPPDRGPGRPGALRSRRGMGRRRGLWCRPRPRRGLLRLRANLLAGLGRRRPATRLCRHPAPGSRGPARRSPISSSRVPTTTA